MKNGILKEIIVLDVKFVLFSRNHCFSLMNFEYSLFAWLALLSSAHVRNVDHIQSWRDLSGDSDRESAKNGIIFVFSQQKTTPHEKTTFHLLFYAIRLHLLRSGGL